MEQASWFALWMRIGLALAAVVCAVGCGGSAARYPMGDFFVEVAANEGRLAVVDARGVTIWATPKGGIELGSGDSQWAHMFGAFELAADSATYDVVARFSGVTATSESISFALQNKSKKALGTATITLAAPGDLRITIALADGIAATKSKGRARLSWGCAASEHFLGFGGQSWDVDHRGQTVPIWVSEDGIGKNPDDDDSATYFVVGKRHTTHTPLPVYVSSAGYGALVETAAFSRFDMCRSDPKRVRVEAWDSVFDLHLFAGPAPKDIVTHLTAHVGRPALPPPFAFAPWLDAIFGSANVRRVAQKLRDAHIASAVIWTEDWRGGVDLGDGTYALDEKWEVDRALYPDIEALATDLSTLGFRFLTYHNSFLDSDRDDYAEVMPLGYTTHTSTGAPELFTGIRFVDTSLLDLSNPAARAWGKDKIKAGLAMGADGHMADFAEWLPPDAVLASGEDANFAHNLYPVEWARLNKEALDEQAAIDGKPRLFFLRSAYLGSQPLVSVVWAGDQQTDFVPGDGFPSVIPMGIGLGMVGFPYFGHDIGGYMSELTTTTDKELWFRWVTLGALSPVMRTHHGRAAKLNYNWETDDEATAHFTRWAKIHMQLFPYLYGIAKRHATTGEPMFAPLAFAHPDFEPGWTRTDEFMLGDQIYVAPVIERGATSRVLSLPKGRYFPLLGGPAVSLDFDTNISVPLGEIGAFVRPGALIVCLPGDVETTEATASAKTLGATGDDRELWVWAGGSTTFTEAGGLTYTWTASSLASAVTSATFGGQAVTTTTAPDGATVIDVVGPGTLSLNDGAATLTLDGNSTRKVRVVLRIN